MSDVVERANAALDGNGAPGMYDDYDQACQWSGLARELIAEVERLRGLNAALQLGQSNLQVLLSDAHDAVEL